MTACHTPPRRRAGRCCLGILEEHGCLRRFLYFRSARFTVWARLPHAFLFWIWDRGLRRAAVVPVAQHAWAGFNLFPLVRFTLHTPHTHTPHTTPCTSLPPSSLPPSCTHTHTFLPPHTLPHTHTTTHTHTHTPHTPHVAHHTTLHLLVNSWRGGS